MKKPGGLAARLDRYAEKLAGNESRGLDREASLALVRASLSELLPAGKTVLVTGTLPESDISAACAGLEKACEGAGWTFVCGGSPFSCPETAALLRDRADAVILVERRMVSDMEHVDRLVDRVRESGKDIAGYVLV